MNRSQRSKSTNSSRLGDLSASSDLNLTVLGSSCPRGPRPLKKTKPPPNSPARGFLSPIDRFIQYRSQGSKLEDGCIISGRSTSVSSSHPDLAIDLSSVSDSYPGTQRSSDSSYDESDWSVPWFPKKRNNEKTKSESSFRTAAESVCSRCSSQLRDRGSDLIEVYVKTVNNTDLSKFFRPCITCGQQNCNCPPIPITPKCAACLEKNCKCQEINQECSECRLRYCLCLPKNISIENCRNSTRRSDLSAARRNTDSGNSTLQLDDSCRDLANKSENGILSRQHVSLSVMQLATAAQCARILADSLENVLQLARDELTPDASGRTDTRPSAIMDSAFPHDTLLSAMDALSKNSSLR